MTARAASEQWDGAPGWPRPRRAVVPGQPALRPSCFVQSDPGNPLSAAQERVQQCFTEFRCQVCGDPVLDVDEVGWVLAPRANIGGACCTRCMHLAVRVCPHLAGVPDDEFEMWAVTQREAYEWHVVEGTAKGHVVPTGAFGRSVRWADFLAHYIAWKRRTT